MSGWDWIHAGLELGTFVAAQRAQQNLGEMKTVAETERARRVLLEAMRAFVFDISRDIQLAEEQIEAYPQQVYIVSGSLDWRLENSGLSPDVFPDFQDKEYFFKTQRKIVEIVGRSKAKLTPQQIEQSDTAIQYVSQIPLLQQAITARSAQESLRATEEQWQDLSSRKGRKSLLVGLGITGMVIAACVGVWLGISGLSLLASERFSGVILGLMMIGLCGAIPIASIVMLVMGGKSLPEYAPLKANRETWKKQLMSGKEWQQVVSTFGNLSSEQLRRKLDEMLAFLQPLLGGDFQRYLTPGD